jgi:ABC-2 type transport system permease protein
MPTMLLSGFMFPVSSMPPLFQWLTVVNPLRHFLEVVRGVFLRDAGLRDLAPEMGALTLLAALLMGLAVHRLARAE